MPRKLLHLILLLPCLLPGQEKVDFDLTYEVFSLPLRESAMLLRQGFGGKELYKQMVTGEGGGIKQERWMNVRVRENELAEVEQTEGFSYLREYEYDKFSPHPVFDGDLTKLPPIPPLQLPSWWAPLTIETKFLGDFLDCQVEQHGEQVLARLTVKHVGLVTVDEIGRGVAQLKYPRFSVQRLSVAVVTTSGQPSLAGTISPPAQKVGKGEKRVWWAFVTIDKI